MTDDSAKKNDAAAGQKQKKKHCVTSVDMKREAYVAMLLHAIKHRNDAVHGILLGQYDPTTSTLTVEQAVGVSHGTPTRPLIETAMGLIQQQTTDSNSNNVIVGWYTAPQLEADSRPSPVALRMVAAIAASASASGDDKSDDSVVEPALIVIQNEALGKFLDEGNEDVASKDVDVIKALGRDFGQQWLDPIDRVHVEQGQHLSTPKLVREALEQGIVVNDLIDHFEDGEDGDNDGASSVWYPNKELSKLIGKIR